MGTDRTTRKQSTIYFLLWMSYTKTSAAMYNMIRPFTRLHRNCRSSWTMFWGERMQLSTRDAIKVMDKLEVEYVDSTHHVRGWFVHEGRRVFPVYTSRGNKQLPGVVAHKFR